MVDWCMFLGHMVLIFHVCTNNPIRCWGFQGKWTSGDETSYLTIDFLLDKRVLAPPEDLSETFPGWGSHHCSSLILVFFPSKLLWLHADIFSALQTTSSISIFSSLEGFITIQQEPTFALKPRPQIISNGTFASPVPEFREDSGFRNVTKWHPSMSVRMNHLFIPTKRALFSSGC